MQVDGGGYTASVHEPLEAAAWIECNWDSPLLTSLRDHGCGGPFACMLSPQEPCLALFGHLEDPQVESLARSLANVSAFPVMMRPAHHNPASTSLVGDVGARKDQTSFYTEYAHNLMKVACMDADEKPLLPEESEHRRQDLNFTQASTPDDKWESPLHQTRIKFQLKLSDTNIYTVNVGCSLKFKINETTEIPIDLSDLARPLSQPEIISLLDLDLEMRPRECKLDRSYANFGFISHRPESIIRRKFLHSGFERPEKTYKHARQQEIQRGIKASLGFSQASPLLTTALSYNRNNNFTLEAADNKVLPKCRVDYEIGEEWDRGDKCFSSYNIAYQPQDLGFQAEQEPLHPHISFVTRKQVLIWVADPASKSGVKGILILITNYISDIKSCKALCISERQLVNLGSGASYPPPRTNDETKPGTISVSVAPVQRQAVNNLGRLRAFLPRINLRSRTSGSASSDIPPAECLARGWDVNNGEWRSVLWPALDKDFRAAGVEGTSPVWNIQSPRRLQSDGVN
ncbi:hypothetical protein R3P38DRAFT_2557043 [Favolaschia claudopus]|uniref:Uncharacterized protein n=1 Tax=Favolaschia claudopus TaxID=2862362 RepID=A0AAW0A829_9AGAR